MAVKRLLITGVQGFVGLNLVAAFKGSYEIYGLDMVTDPVDGVKAVYTLADFESGAVPPVDAIIHLAGKAHDTTEEPAWNEYFQVNTRLTECVYDYFVRTPGVERFIFFSSIKAAAQHYPGSPITEDIDPTPEGPYGESKRLAERYIESHPAPPGKSVYVLRPCLIYGHGVKGNLKRLDRLCRLICGVFPCWPLASFENRRSYVGIGNVIYVLRRLLEDDIPPASGVYNLADDEAISTNGLVRIISSGYGKRMRMLRTGTGFVNCLASIGTKLHLPFNRRSLDKLTENYVVSNTKIKQALGLERLPVDIETGLKSAFTKKF